MFNGTKTVIFDLEDTLFLQKELLSNAFSLLDTDLERKFGIHSFRHHAQAMFTENPRAELKHLFAATFMSLGISEPEELTQRCLSWYNSHFPTITLLPDAKRFIEILATCSSLSVLGKQPNKLFQNTLQALRLFEYIHPAQMLYVPYPSDPNHANNEEIFRKIEHKSSASGEECIYISDNPDNDFQLPKKLGWKTIRIRRQESLCYEVPSHSWIDLEIEDLDILLRMLIKETQKTLAMTAELEMF